MKHSPNFEVGSRIVLCIGAHPDDCEFRCGGTAALWSGLGDTIIFLSLTDGSSGTFRENPQQIRERRKLEAAASVAIIHGKSRCMECVDGSLTPSLENRFRLISLIREIQPDIIVTNRPNDYHPDHRYAAQLVQDASYMLQVPNVVSEVPPLRYVPVIMYWGDSFEFPYRFSPRAIVDIDSVLDTKIAMLSAHESQMYEWLPWVDSQLEQVPPPEAGSAARKAWTLALYRRRAVPTYAERYRDLLCERYGELRGMAVVEAEAFEMCEYGYHVDGALIKRIFAGV